MDELEKNKKQTQIFSVKEGLLANISFGLADQYISPYFIALKISSFGLGLLNAIPNILGPIFQIWASYLIKVIPRKKIIITAVLGQAFIYFLLAFLTILIFYKVHINIYLLILVFSFYVALGSISWPAWLSLIGDIVEKEKLGNFFAFRNSVGVIGGTLAGILAGLVLDFLKITIPNNLLWGFIFLFILAGILHFVRIFYFKKHYEPKLEMSSEHYFSLLSFIKRLPFNNFGRFVLLTSLISFAVNISGPYYNLYIFRDLKFSYLQFLILSIVTSLSSLFTFNLWGKLIDKFGSVDVLRVGGFLVSLVPLLWFFTIYFDRSTNFIFLIFVHIIAGIGWGGYGLAMNSFLYTSVTRPRRALCSSYHSLISGICILLGSFLGSFLIETFKSILPFNSIMFASLISGILRFTSVLMLLIFVKEPLEIKKSLFEAIKYRIIKLESFIIHQFDHFIAEGFFNKIFSRYIRKSKFLEK
jgi:MFS family permease